MKFVQEQQTSSKIVKLDFFLLFQKFSKLWFIISLPFPDLSSSKLLVLMIYTSCVSTCLDVNGANGEALLPWTKLVLLFGVAAILDFEFFNTDARLVDATARSHRAAILIL